ncbi:hypothetical protein os1_19970 [Comamonadaceae bacterium OS-1]|nr:hypothetical protein os1_19970 [Comamonadaceae bacterium OS-1]
MSRRFRSTGMAWALLALTGCATLSPDGDLGAVQQLIQGKTAGVSPQLSPNPQAVADLLAQPLSAEAAVRIALLNSPQLQFSLATLGVSDADRVQMGRLPNPHFAMGRFTEGDTREIERVLSFNVLGLLALPWRAQWQGQQHAMAQLQAAQDVVRLAADTRKAWITAVAAQQSALYLRDVKEAAEAGAELARRMARVGNWSRLEQAREQVLLADATAQLARARNLAYSTREKLTRLMGLWGAQTGFVLADRLPDLPKAATEMTDIEAQALRERLDVRAAVARTSYIARQEGFDKVAGYFDGLALSYTRNTTFDNAAGSKSAKRGWELELPLPLFDWGGARNARSKAVYLQSTAQVRAVAIQARSEAREAYFGYRTAFDLAVHYRDEIVPLRKFINDELVLRYSGMLASVWELLADTRQQSLSVGSAIEAQRDFWLAEADLQIALTGTSPGALASLLSGAAADTASTQGH